ncbi:MAG: 5-formyltetrahydrofolate cyclo-ligase [Pyrinomonadaceae bacterium]|nr:5-formyltetrahydrofolate cyclo-ligase [Pyrinomonadaceae bacterium]MCX7639307.1 5-formyltetrahydrofolate cyclo-ligase [Pyrinomonadaceae bacterium]MDW8303471.1 5-formyltetrahydrofolate cyclo-ligase [Acidobacteriota bacterium]
MKANTQNANKAKLRKIFLQKRLSLSCSELETMSKQVAEKFFTYFDLSNKKNLHCFLPIDKFNEINTLFIFEKVWKEFPNVKTFAPKVNFETNSIESIRFTQFSTVEQNKWGIKEPTSGEAISSSEIELVILPLLCFDKRGHRVGYGKGFYDRFLKGCKKDCLKIGLSLFEPVESILDVTEEDIKMDYCITPSEVFKFV